MTRSWSGVFLVAFLVCLFAAGGVSAERAGVMKAALPHNARSPEWMGGPVVGFLAGNSPAGIRAILGVPGAAVAGEPLPLPEGVTRVRLAPGHRYALLDFDGAAPPAILSLEADGAPYSLAEAAMPIDQVEFSPTGRSAALYSAAGQRIQIWTGLPREPRLTGDRAAPEAARFALSDDGRWLLVASASGAVDLIAPDGGTRPVFRAPAAPAMAFLPDRPEAVVSGGERGEIHLLGGLDGVISTRLLAAGLEGVDSVAASADGSEIIALASQAGGGWRIDVPSGAARPFDLPVRPEFIESMRVPDAFLISSRAGEPAWLLIPDETGTRAYFVPAVAKSDAGVSQ